MNMTEKNGQPSMEEILASIRRIIAEEPGEQHNGELGGTPILLRGDGVLDDAGDFDLPAIFRASPPQTDRHTPLLGRLTDAIRNATAAQPEIASTAEADAHEALSSLTLRSAEYANGHVNGNGHLNGAQYANGAGYANGTGYVNGSAYGHEPAPQVQEPVASPTAVSAASADEPKRVMAAFKDTHFTRMTQPAAPLAAPAPVVVAPVEVAPPVQFTPPVQVAPPVHVEAPVDVVAHVVNEQPSFEVAPPPLPPSAAPTVVESSASGGMEDTTADLLRPMLRQWLAENMPRMVEKALHIEIAESVKTPRKS
jgi:cell pole-organizing protein PopZ